MCGFVVEQSDGATADSLGGMVETLRHRGPDEKGFWDHPVDGVAMAQGRLSVIDPEGGHQPMERDGYAIVHNGEIYNFRALRKTLRQHDLTFSTDSDTEVLLQGYRHWGREVFDRVRGMFAAALWDPERRELVLARDPAGQKPLFYTLAGEGFTAASEIQALMASEDVPASADHASLSWYLSLGYIPSPRSGFAKIKKLPPGHYLRISGGSVVDQVRYWDPVSYTRSVDPPPDPVEATRERVTEAVRRRLVSDVPLGAFLSGGIDSSIVVGLMASLADGPVRTFSAGFEDPADDERPHARAVAQRHGTDHRDFTVEANLRDLLPRLVRHFGEPFADSSAVPTFALARRTRQSVKVALAGDGGDEVFGGYRRYRAMRWLSRADDLLPAVLRRGVQGIARAWGSPADRRSSGGELLRLLQQLGGSDARRYLAMVGLGGEDVKPRLVKGPLARPGKRGGEEWLERWFRRFDHLEDPAARCMAVDLMSYLPGDLLVKTDITTMMNSLECRTPLLDRDVVELGLSLPGGIRMKGTRSKHVLKQAFSDMLPEGIEDRPKQGFGVPLAEWFRSGPRADVLREMLLDPHSSFEAIVDRPRLEDLLRDHREGRTDRAPFLWALTVLRQWMEAWEVRV